MWALINLKKITMMKLKLLYTLFLAGIFFSTAAQQVPVSGTVTDAKDGSSMPGVNVIIENTTQGTVTDIDGKFTLNVPDKNSVLVFSFLSYVTQKITVGEQTVINVKLSEDITKLDEVVVIGYGTSKKKDLTGALATLKGDDLNKAGATTPEQLLQGKVSGVQIVSNNGEPGSGSQIKIRGASSIRSGQQPLYVVDGIPFDEQTTSPDGISGAALGGAPATSPLTSINPNDIESIDILKDASAAAIYGSRGANGVIIITTKKGKEGVSEVSYSTTLSISQLPKKLPMLSSTAWVKFRKDSLKNTDNNFLANTDWQDQIFRTAISNDQNLSISGGTNKSSYRASFNYANQQGIIDKSDLTRYAGRLNLTQKALNDKLNFEVNLSGSQVVENRVPVGATGFEGDVLLNALQANPTWPVRDSLGNPWQGNALYTFSTSDRNPVAMLQYTNDLTRTTNIIGGLAATLEIFKGLNYKINFGMNYTNANRTINQSQKLSYMVPTLGSGQINNKELYNYVIEHTLNYNKEIGAQTFNIMAGYSYQQFMNRGSDITGQGFITDGIPYTNVIGSGTPTLTSISSYFDTDNKMQSFFGRLNYNLKEKYLLTATIRADGSDKFGPNKQYGYFPSFAAGWRISEEQFMKNLNAFSNLKLRFGWGQTGNSEIELNQPVPSYRYDNASKAIVGGTTIIGLAVARTANANVTWETTTSNDLGLDFGILKGRISGSIDLYQKVTSDLLLTIPSAPLSPSNTVVRNLDSAKVINKGLEMSLTGVVISNSKASWEITGNLSFLNSKVTGLNKAIYLTGSAQGQGLTGAYVEVIANNQPINEFYGNRIVSIDGRGRVQYLKSKMGTGFVDSVTYLGSPQPKFTWSLINNFKYGNWDLSIFIEGVHGNKIFNNTALLLDKTNLNQSKNALDYFISDKVNINRYNPAVSDRYIEDGSYIRLSSVTLGYNLNFKNSPWIKRMRIFIQGTNLLLITKYKGFDPDVSSSKDANGINSFGIDITNYPKAITGLAGLNVTF
jgi:TonB-dependent starch-binding outer membrane protein SusC